MIAKTTPGPWAESSRLPPCDPSEEHAELLKGKPYIFLTIDGLSVSGYMSDADARLIQQAPIMLELLQEILDGTVKPYAAPITDFRQRIEAIFAAINHVETTETKE